LRFAVPAILAAAAVAECFSCFVATPERVEADGRLPPAVLYSTGPNARASTRTDQPLNADERAAAAFQKAAEAILRRAPNVRASAGADANHGSYPVAKKAADHAPMTLGVHCSLGKIGRCISNAAFSDTAERFP
jgi:hypothetical protein